MNRHPPSSLVTCFMWGEEDKEWKGIHMRTPVINSFGSYHGSGVLHYSSGSFKAEEFSDNSGGE